MKCVWVKDNVLLYVYNELPDDARYELEQHLARCPDCTAELKAARKFHAVLSELPVEEPSPNLLAASRMRLQEALETAQPGGFWRRLAFDPGAWLRQVQLAPALAAVLFILGFAGGVGTSYKLMSNSGNLESLVPRTAPPAATESSIAAIRSISQNPGSSTVSIQYDTISTQQAQGSLNDQRIQQLLLFAARNNYNSGVRMDSVDLLTQQPNDNQVREALIYALRYDSNPGVRLKALDGLAASVKSDARVRDALLEALLVDSNLGVRAEALHLLEPVRADSSVRAVLERLAQHDENAYIKSQARSVLAQLPEFD
ncbi:MAG TPA: HEAT repeat domain-containing protein [Terriglobales bacterium]|nr:HEAT repeat domain-containing protein [Terriglobales bacterium]